MITIVNEDMIYFVADYFNYSVQEVEMWADEVIISAYYDAVHDLYLGDMINE